MSSNTTRVLVAIAQFLRLRGGHERREMRSWQSWPALIVQPVGLSDGCCSEKSRLPSVHLVNDEAPDEIGEEPDDAEKRQARDQYDGHGYEAKAQAQCKVEDGWANREDGDTRTEVERPFWHPVQHHSQIPWARAYAVGSVHRRT